ncbi:hypothetical protein [Streptomyces sp. NPDC056013]|uniref:hypothetical protein n=1 Tax=Streptomyces sp. NPDC056013 TaxID=3345680 RepID=UPI0035DEA74E
MPDLGGVLLGVLGRVAGQDELRDEECDVEPCSTPVGQGLVDETDFAVADEEVVGADVAVQECAASHRRVVLRRALDDGVVGELRHVQGEAWGEGAVESCDGGQDVW